MVRDPSGTLAVTEAEGEALVHRLTADFPGAHRSAVERIVRFFVDESGADAIHAGERYRTLHSFFYARPWLAVADRIRFALEVLKFADGHGRTVLEIGAGCGITSAFLALCGAVVSQDISVDEVTTFSRWLDYLDLGDLPVSACVGDASGLSFPDSAFDVCTADGMLSHVSSLEGTLAEVRRVLRPGGRLFVQDENNALIAEGRARRRAGKWARAEAAYRPERARIIHALLPDLPPVDVEDLADRTLALTAADIRAFADGESLPEPVTEAPRDPHTGVYVEREMSPFWLREKIESLGFTQARLIPIFVPLCCARPDSALAARLKLRAKYVDSLFSSLAARLIDSMRIVAVAGG